jgi:hypothetical protein
MPVVKPIRGAQLELANPHARGLRGCYLFNEGTGEIVSDLSGYRNIGSFLYDPSWVSCTCGHAIDFDGGDDEDMISLASEIQLGDFTILLSCNRHSGNSYYGIICGQKDSNADYIRFQLGSYIRWQLSYTSYNWDSITDFSGWHVWAITRRGTAGYAYKDGVLRQTIAVGSNPFHVSLIAGGNYYSGGYNHGFDGQMGWFQIYDYALSDRQVHLLSRQPFAMFESPVRPELMYAAQAAVPLAGSINAESIASASLKLSRRIGGTVTAVSDATAILESIGAPPETQRDWLREALFNGMTANAFKLGNTLSMGWFWVRTTGCSALYRGLSMERIDFANVLTVAGQDACTISPPSYLPHNSNYTYFYLIRRFNNCGYQEHTLSAAVKVSIDQSGELGKPQPNKVFSARAEQVNGDKIQLVWFYCPIGQESGPVSFNIYYDGRTGQIDYGNPIATIVYRGRKFYRYESDALEAGRYLFAIRAEDAGGIENDSLAQFSVQLGAANPDKIEILGAAAV